MTDQYIQLPLDATGGSSGASGKKLDTSQITVNTQTVQRQRIAVGDPVQAGLFASIATPGALYTAGDPFQLFFDAFVTLDTTNRWNAGVAAGGGVAAAVVAGVGDITLGTGTTINGYSYITTQMNFLLAAPGFLYIQDNVKLEFPITANTYRFWGSGNPAATPTAAAPFIDALGWEVSTAGKMYAICYATNTRNVVQDLSTSTGNSTQPADANVHKYVIYYRGELAYWTIDGIIVATMPTGVLGPVNNTLPHVLMAVAGASAPGSSGVLTDTGVFIGDTTSQGIQISDGTYAWRKATVNAAGALSVLTNADATIDGTAAPSKGLLVLGQSDDTTPVYAPMPLSVGGESLVVCTEGNKKTYSSEVSGTAVTGVNVSIPGNATTTVRITRVEVSLSTTGTAGIETVSLIKTSAAPTSGTSAAMTVVPHDSAFAGANSTPLSWFGGAPTPGTPVGTIRGIQMFDESATVAGANTWLWTFGGERNTSPVVLRGTVQTLEVNLSGTIATQTIVISIEWEEDLS